MEITVDSASLKVIAGLLLTTIASLITGTVTLVRRYRKIEDVEVAVLGDVATGRKGLRRVVLGDVETGEIGLVSLTQNVVAIQKQIDRHEKVVNGMLRGFDVLDEDAIAETVRGKVRK